jgi:hypothetical protein
MQYLLRDFWGLRPGLWRSLRMTGTVVLVVAGTLIAPAVSPAAISIFGSPLSVPSTLNTAENLNYRGTDTAVPPSAEAPNGVVHTYHFGADTALWNVTVGGHSASAAAGGQAVRIRLEGCAQASSGGPPPLTQIHFQVLSPTPGGGVKVALTSAAFDIPICGHGGASGTTVSAYEPVNLCVSQGDYVAFNDEGGFVEHSYQSGVPYKVLGAVGSSGFNSFIRGGGTNNGDLFSPADASNMDGFAANQGKELMMQVTLGTGPDARYVCPGGSKDAPAVYAPISVHPQTDGINHARVAAVAIFCRPTSGCSGTAALTLPGKRVSIGSTSFNLHGSTTSHVPIRLVPQVMRLIRAKHGVSATLTVTAAGATVSQTITVKIF